MHTSLSAAPASDLTVPKLKQIMASRLRGGATAQGSLFDITGTKTRMLQESVKKEISLMISAHANRLEHLFTSAKAMSFAE